MLGLTHKGHLGPGADADITIYTPGPDIKAMFELPSNDPIQTFAIGGWLNVIKRAPFLAAGLVREQDAGRCGFVVIDSGSNGFHARATLKMPGVVPVSDLLRISGPHAATIQDHTHHAPGSAGSECVACHMPKIEQTIADVNVRSHTFAFITPSLTDEFKVPNACTSCHTDKATDWARDALRSWSNVSPWRSLRRTDSTSPPGHLLFARHSNHRGPDVQTPNRTPSFSPLEPARARDLAFSRVTRKPAAAGAHSTHASSNFARP